MAKKKIDDLIAEWMTEYCSSNPYELARSEFVKEGATWYLRVYVDKIEAPAEAGEEFPTYGYISTDECAEISHYLDKKLDKADPIEQKYVLEVSSPGMDRPLITERDFRRFMGEAIEIKLYEPIDGKKLIEGILTDYKDGIVTVTENENVIELPREKAAKINLAVIF